MFAELGSKVNFQSSKKTYYDFGPQPGIAYKAKVPRKGNVYVYNKAGYRIEVPSTATIIDVASTRGKARRRRTVSVGIKISDMRERYKKYTKDELKELIEQLKIRIAKLKALKARKTRKPRMKFASNAVKLFDAERELANVQKALELRVEDEKLKIEAEKKAAKAAEAAAKAKAAAAKAKAAALEAEVRVREGKAKLAALKEAEKARREAEKARRAAKLREQELAIIKAKADAKRQELALIKEEAIRAGVFGFGLSAKSWLAMSAVGVGLYLVFGRRKEKGGKKA